MHITLRFAGFREIDQSNGLVTLEHDLRDVADYPSFMRLSIDDAI